MNTIAKSCAALRSCCDSLTGSWPYGSLKEQHDTMNWGTKSTLYFRDYSGGVEETKLSHPSCTVTQGVMRRRGKRHQADVGFIQCERHAPSAEQHKNNVIVLLMGVNTSKEFLNLELLDLCTEYGTVICPDMRGVGDSIHHGGRGSWVETLGVRHGCLRVAHFSHEAYPKLIKTMLLTALVGTVLLSVYSPWTAVGLGMTGLLLGGILYRAAPAFTLDDLADDVVTLLKKVGLEDRSTLFVGLSMGSMVAQTIILRPDRPVHHQGAGLIFPSFGPAIGAVLPKLSFIRQLRHFGAKNDWRSFINLLSSEKQRVHLDASCQWVTDIERDYPASGSSESRIAHVSAIIAAPDRRRSMIKALNDVQVLAIAGADDPLLKAENLRDFEERLDRLGTTAAKQNFASYTMAGVGHWLIPQGQDTGLLLGLLNAFFWDNFCDADNSAPECTALLNDVMHRHHMLDDDSAHAE